MKIQKSSQDYLESMLMMQQERGYIRSIDVAEHLGVTKPSVSYATKRLRENGYITMDREGFITLTDSGMAIAASMLDRHHTLTRFLITLGVDPKVAEWTVRERDLDDPDFDLPLDEKGHLDVDEWLCQEFMFQIPTVLLCSADCPGLCPRCGKKMAECTCPPAEAEAEPADARLAILKSLLN